MEGASGGRWKVRRAKGKASGGFDASVSCDRDEGEEGIEGREHKVDGEKNQERISGGSTSIIYHRLRAFECNGVSSSATGVLMVPSHRHAPSSSPVDLRRV